MSKPLRQAAFSTLQGNELWEDGILRIYETVLGAINFRARGGFNSGYIAVDFDAAGKFFEDTADKRNVVATLVELLRREGFRARGSGDYIRVSWPTKPVEWSIN